MSQVPVRIDRSSPVPLYHQLAEQLTAAVTSGVLSPGDSFENEIAMSRRLALSRPTVRRAIQELVDQGLLLRRRGLGTTVANRHIHRRAGLTSLYDDLADAGEAPTTRLLRCESELNHEASISLGLEPDTPLLAITRLRRSGGRPLALMRNWLPPRYAGVADADLAAVGLYSALRAMGVRPVVAHQRFGARRPQPHERRLLELKASEPVLTMTRSAFDAVGEPVEFGDHSYRAQDYSIEVMLDER